MARNSKTFWPITQKPEFCQIPDSRWNIKNNIRFHFWLFPRKTNGEIFLKIHKNPILGPFWVLSPNLGKNEFSWKKEPCQFLNIPIIYNRTNNQKILMSHYWGKPQSDVRTERQTDRHWLFYRTLRRTGIQILNRDVIFQYIKAIYSALQ